MIEHNLDDQDVTLQQVQADLTVKQDFWDRKPVGRDVLLALVWGGGFAFLSLMALSYKLPQPRPASAGDLRSVILPFIQVIALIIFVLSYQMQRTNRALKAIVKQLLQQPGRS